MPVPLGLLLFSVLLTPGDSLECETCLGLDSNCNGTMERCSTHEDTCSVAFVEATVAEVTSQEIRKGCLSTHACGLAPFYLNLGKMFIARGKAVCCEGNDCASVSPQVPPINNTANGKKCPACLSLMGPCSSELAECTGAEDYCLDGILKSAPGWSDFIIRGCTTKSYCAILEKKIGPANIFGSVVGKCEPADKAPPSL
ncbi:phospholipase A2 inhibitor subunit gamma B-like [Podarcis lilfordi]|uniref:Phospholipase A2 inhibitor subunit gamma B-like n=1 Tax=Podarcis lilfordi TaxID=74358 RepID=A0AA35KMU7_9SAUR|nr:phospholipase A2 inhibitor subunit gamma B-like [Podarcis lilfordi]